LCRQAKKRKEKLCYLHRNPVKRGLVEKPEDWEWSSFRHYSPESKAWSKSSRSGPGGDGRAWDYRPE